MTPPISNASVICSQCHLGDRRLITCRTKRKKFCQECILDASSAATLTFPVVGFEGLKCPICLDEFEINVGVKMDSTFMFERQSRLLSALVKEKLESSELKAEVEIEKNRLRRKLTLEYFQNLNLMNQKKTQLERIGVSLDPSIIISAPPPYYSPLNLTPRTIQREIISSSSPSIEFPPSLNAILKEHLITGKDLTALIFWVNLFLVLSEKRVRSPQTHLHNYIREMILKKENVTLENKKLMLAFLHSRVKREMASFFMYR